jgi:3'-phosphoadenosine 5'-phosphosulfate sulfotransferase (PAPS reductase)/FAD synthetase
MNYIKSKTKSMVNVFNFSGGRTSAYMVIKYWKEGDLVIFTDTGREHPKTYKFINDFEAYEKIPVIRTSLNQSNDAFREMLAKKKFKALPHRMKRFCTPELKVKVAKRFLRSMGIQHFNNFIGFRVDEPNRIKNKIYYKKVHNKYPLFYDGITKQMILEYFKNKPYDLEIPHILGNCTLCFLKGKNAIIAILREYPELAEKWIEDEEEAQKNGKYGGHTYFKNITIKELRSIAQNNLFKNYDLNKIESSYTCKCTNF